ncbi:hypothetical protein BDR26DRAFT_929911 [Obelidium mucronatum]|nr:hypothetical protein BDR26DRAFT_929911 [Obelidium mucronatum]
MANSSTGLAFHLKEATPKQIILTLSRDANAPPQELIDPKTASQDLTNMAESIILRAISTTQVHQDRLIYAVIGLLFIPASPKPFGGSKTKPGYRLLVGQSASDLFSQTIKVSLDRLILFKDAAAIEAVVAATNRVLNIQESGSRDEMNELVMKGLQKSGHIEWRQVGSLPEFLRQKTDLEVVTTCVEFTPSNRQSSTMNKLDFSLVNMALPEYSKCIQYFDSLQKRSGTNSMLWTVLHHVSDTH